MKRASPPNEAAVEKEVVTIKSQENHPSMPTPSPSSHDPEALMTMAEVRALSGLSAPNIYARMKRREFPIPRKLGTKSVRWERGEILEWKRNLPRAEFRDMPNESDAD